MFIDLAAERRDFREIYKLCISFVTPRPIALVSSVAPDGSHNLAPFSFFNMVCANPPTVMFCPGLRRGGGDKHTYDNVSVTREFVVAIVDEPIGRQMVDCAADLPAGVSEFEFSGLTPIAARKVRAPLVQEAPVNLECTLSHVVHLGRPGEPGGSHVVFGEIVAIHVRDAILGPDGAVDPARLRTVGRLGGQWYCTADRPYRMAIPEVDERGARRA